MASLTTNTPKARFVDTLRLKFAKRMARTKSQDAMPDQDPRAAQVRRDRARADVDRLLHRAH